VSLFAEDPGSAPDLFLAENYPDAAHPSLQAGVFFASTAPLNYFAYKNAQIDRLIDAAALVTDPTDRDRRYLDISQRLFADMAFVPLADIRGVIVYREGLLGLDPRPALPWVVDYESIRRE
jgi:peptide/nickel transport system substrate-binding protein